MDFSAASVLEPVGSALQFDMDDCVYITLTCPADECWARLEAMEREGWEYVGTLPPATEMVFRRARMT